MSYRIASHLLMHSFPSHFRLLNLSPPPSPLRRLILSIFVCLAHTAPCRSVLFTFPPSPLLPPSKVCNAFASVSPVMSLHLSLCTTPPHSAYDFALVRLYCLFVPRSLPFYSSVFSCRVKTLSHPPLSLPVPPSPSL